MEKMVCPYCGKEAQWTSNEVVYGMRYGKSWMCYYCRDCDAYVGCHQNSRQPLGTMANKELRRLRIQAHKVFDPLWKNGGMTRKQAYEYLKQHLGSETHIGSSNEVICKAIIDILTPKPSTNLPL